MAKLKKPATEAPPAPHRGERDAISCVSTEGRFTVPLWIQLAAPRQGSGQAEQAPAGSLYRVTFIKAGYVRKRDGQAAAWRIPPETLQAAVGLLDSRAVFLDHSGPWDYPSLRNLIGVTSGPEWNAATESIEGVIRLYDSESGELARQLLKQVLADQMAGREVPDVGLSLVFYGRHDWIDVGEEPGEEYERVTVEIRFVESCDLVFGPGADGRVKEALHAVAASFPALRPAGQCGASAAAPSAAGTPQNPPQPPEGGRETQDFASQLSEQAPNGASDITLGGVTMDENDVQQTQDFASQQLNTEEVPAAAQQNAVLGAPASNGGQQQQAVPVAPAAVATPGEADRLSRIEQTLERLTSALGNQEQGQVVEGMGQPPRPPAGGRVQGMRTGLERFAPNIEWLFGVPDAPYPDPQFRRADMIYQALTGDWEWRGLYNPDRVMLAGANTTDLPNMAVNAMNKVLLLSWASLRAYRWYELVAAVVANDGSTQPMTWIGAGGVEVLPVVAEKGPYTELSMADSKEQDDFTKYGGYVGITLEMFRRSEIAKIQAVPLGLARSSVMKRSANIAGIFTANAGVGPTLDQDSKALFHDDHGNVATTAFGTDSTAWNAVDLAIWNQTELGSAKPLAISPKFMLCNRALFRAALVVFGYGDGQPTTYVPEAMDRGPDDPRPWPIAVPDFTDTTDWAAIVDPKLYPVIMMSYAQATQGGGHPMPELYAVTNETQGLVFTNDLLPVKVRDWYAYGVSGYRGIAKRNVT